MLKWSFAIAVVMLCIGCTTSPPRDDILKTLEISSNPHHPASYLGAPLRTGQILVSEDGSPLSLLFSLFSTKYSPYVHSGILVFHNGYPFVYEARGVVKMRTGVPPTDATKGRIKRRPLGWFLHRQNYVAVYDLPEGVNHEKVADFVVEQYQAKREFDPYFNAQDRDKVYCTEFVALALEAGGAPPVPLTPIQKNDSLAVVLKWLKVTAPSLILAQSMLSEERHVATFSRKLTPKQLRLYQAAKREMHARFTDDQKLGNVFRWTGGGLKYKDPVAQFFKRATLLAPGIQEISAQEAQLAVERLALKMFGPIGKAESVAASH